MRGCAIAFYNVAGAGRCDAIPDAGERSAMKLGAVERCRAVDEELVAEVVEHIDEYRSATLRERGVPVAAR